MAPGIAEERSIVFVYYIYFVFLNLYRLCGVEMVINKFLIDI